MKRIYLLSTLLLAYLQPVLAQNDTVRISNYNLLNYGSTANPYAYKNARLAPILQQIRPNLIGFNEINAFVPGLHDTLLSVMPYPFQHGPIHNTTNTSQLDGLFWQVGKFHLLSDNVICNDVRDIVAYELYHDYSGLATYHDTIKLIVITAHLKSSNAVSDRSTRAGEAQKVATYLSSLPDSSNVVMMGDFNLYTSGELAYQYLTNNADTPARLYDPLNMPGNWDNNPAFAAIHTQSPRLAALPDGGASGGLDSRFDFILLSDAIMKGWKGIRYLPGSYTAYGNDGHHFGKSLIDTPTNTAVSAAIAQALYECSDHLPVFANLVFLRNHPAAGISALANLQQAIQVVNPFRDRIQLLNNTGASARLRYQLRTVEGRIVNEGMVNTVADNIPVQGLNSGVYFLSLSDPITGSNGFYRLVHVE